MLPSPLLSVPGARMNAQAQEGTLVTRLAYLLVVLALAVLIAKPAQAQTYAVPAPYKYSTITNGNINVTKGDFSLSSSDVSVGSSRIAFVRSYSSILPGSSDWLYGPLGQGGSHNFNISLRCIVCDGDPSTDDYEEAVVGSTTYRFKNAVGTTTFTNVNNDGATLSYRDADNNYVPTLTLKDGAVIKFLTGSDGYYIVCSSSAQTCNLATYIEYPNGEFIKLSYEPTYYSSGKPYLQRLANI